jgi:hypothetical protein
LARDAGGSPDGTILSRGRGGHTLCEKCNSTTGGDYGGAFVEFVRQSLETVHEIRERPRFIYRGEVFPLRVIKQIAVMFFDTSGPHFRGRNPALVEFVMDRRRTGLPSGYRFYAFWMLRGLLRQSGVAGHLNTETGESSVLAEVVHPPFGYVLGLGGTRLNDRRPTEITDFANYAYDDRRQIRRLLPVLPTLWTMPGDYRSEAELDHDVRVNDLAARGHPDPEAGAHDLEGR